MATITRFMCENARFCVTDNGSPRFTFACDCEDIKSAFVYVNGEKIPAVRGKNVCYSGKPLAPFTVYSARLEVECEGGGILQDTLTFETGRLDTPWRAKFITDGSYVFKQKRTSPQPMLFRKKFELKGGVKRAVVYATAIGVYELSLNGKKVGDEYFAPGFTAYKTNLYYQTYDITDSVKENNEFTADVAGGWAVGSFVFTRKNRITAKRQSFMCEIRVEYADGSVEVIATDEKWQVTRRCATVAADLYDGEIYDARIAPADGDFVPAAVEKVKIHPSIRAFTGVPVKRHEVFEPVSVNKVGGGLVYDFGQNFAGVVEMKIKGKEGAKITVRHAEILKPDGTLNTGFLRTAKATIEYICRDGEQVYSPRFTYMGFRYVGVEGIDESDIIEIRAHALYSDLRQIGSFECSNELINKLNRNIIWSAKSNFVDIPTDCPQRDERMGWTGDIAMFAPTACFDFDMSRFFEKWLCDMRAEQRRSGAIRLTVPIQGYGFPATMPAMAVAFWGDACILVPYEQYKAGGDLELLRVMYPAMKKYVKACRFWAGFGIGKHRYIWHVPAALQYGDWVSPDEPKMSGWQKRSKWTATASLYNSSKTLAEIASLLGFEADAARYSKLAKKVGRAYVDVFTDGNGKIEKPFQTAYVLPLRFGMFEGKAAENALENLVRLIEKNDYCIATGIPGTPHILFALADGGRADVAYKMLLNTKCPSWLYEVNAGATTLWERWDGLNESGVCDIADDVPGGMVSYNHYVFGSVGAFLYKRVLGIEPTSGGYETFKVEPVIGGGLTYAKGHVETRYGRIEAAWKISDGKFTLDVTVPCGTRCTAALPDGTKREIGSGKHSFECPHDFLCNKSYNL